MLEGFWSVVPLEGREEDRTHQVAEVIDFESVQQKHTHEALATTVLESD